MCWAGQTGEAAEPENLGTTMMLGSGSRGQGAAAQLIAVGTEINAAL